MANSKGHSAHFHTITQTYPRAIRHDARDLIRVFLTRKTRRLKLADNYLCLLWEVSRATVQRRLADLERLGLIRRLTFPPKKEGGRWSQHRLLHLLVPQKQSRLKEMSPTSHSIKPSAKSKLAALSFKDWLSLRQDVPIGAWLYWCRRWGAIPSTFGHLRRVWELIQHRADILEEIIWDCDRAKFQGKQRVGFIVSEIRARVA